MQCHVCRQDTLTEVIAEAWGQKIILYRCSDCDSPICPVCRAHSPAWARYCIGCGHPLTLHP